MTKILHAPAWRIFFVSGIRAQPVKSGTGTLPRLFRAAALKDAAASAARCVVDTADEYRIFFGDFYLPAEVDRMKLL